MIRLRAYTLIEVITALLIMGIVVVSVIAIFKILGNTAAIRIEGEKVRLEWTTFYEQLQNDVFRASILKSTEKGIEMNIGGEVIEYDLKENNIVRRVNQNTDTTHIEVGTIRKSWKGNMHEQEGKLIDELVIAPQGQQDLFPIHIKKMYAANIIMRSEFDGNLSVTY